MKVQQVPYFSLFSCFSFASASLLDFKYDFCDSNSLLLSINLLCERPGTSTIELPILHGSPSKPQQVLGSAHDHSHHHNHDHDHGVDEHSLWSVTPHCLQRQNATTKFCVYTDQAFASNRGISFFTNSNHASRIRKFEAFTPTSVLKGANTDSDPRYASIPIPGKGLGLVALRPIHRGEELFRSTPVLILEEDEYNETERLPYYHLATKQLPKQSKRMFDELKGHFGGDPVEDKINTNCFAVELDVEGVPVTAMAVFPEMSVRYPPPRVSASWLMERRQV